MAIRYLIKVYGVGVDDELLEWLVLSLRDMFNADVEAVPRGLPIGEALRFYNHQREQVDAAAMLDYLQERIRPPPGGRILVIVNGDGYVEGLNFVFGVAKPGWGGIVFTGHLDPTFYGQPPSPGLLRARLLKEALHELGHSYGLSHCRGDCVMRFSNSVYDVDKKPARFCPRCRAELNYLQPGLLR